MIEVDESADGRVIELSPDGDLQISLKENPTTGFNWVPVEMAAPVCGTVADHFESGITAQRGSGGIHHWRLKAEQKGTGKIVLTYKRPWESKPPLRTFRLTVRVN